MSKVAPATPLPWEATRKDDKHGNWITCYIGQAINIGGHTVAKTLGPTNPDFMNAAYIAHAANAYPALIAALQSALSAAKGDWQKGASWDRAATKLLRELGEL